MIKEKKIHTFVVFLCFIMTILGLSSCRNYYYLPIPPLHDVGGDIHSHSWADNAYDYSLSDDGVITAYFKCNGCDEIKEEVVARGAITVTAENAAAEAAKSEAVVVASPDTIQTILDNITSKAIVFLKDGTYENLELKPQNNQSRTISSLRIIGGSDAKIISSDSTKPALYIRGSSALTIDGLRIDNVKFQITSTGQCIYLGSNDGGQYDDFVFTNCTFTGSGTLSDGMNASYGFRSWVNTPASYSGFSFEDCIFTGLDMGVYSQANNNGYRIIRCTFENCGYGFNHHYNGENTGDLDLIDNIFIGAKSNPYAIFGLNKTTSGSSTIKVTGNSFKDNDTVNSLLYITDNRNVTVVLSDNTYESSDSGRIVLASCTAEIPDCSFPEAWAMRRDGTMMYWAPDSDSGENWTP